MGGDGTEENIHYKTAEAIDRKPRSIKKASVYKVPLTNGAIDNLTEITYECI